ncbi:MAG TPA: hypothetical protein VGH93_03160 [Solirubrobacteraceae bacterium]
MILNTDIPTRARVGTLFAVLRDDIRGLSPIAAILRYAPCLS